MQAPRLFWFLCLLPVLPLFSQSHLGRAAADRILNEVLTRHKDGLRLSVKSDRPLKISCPMGVRCDETFDYRALTYNYSHPDFDIFIYFSFSPKLIGDWTDANVRERYGYMYHIIQVKELRAKGWDVRLGYDQPYRKGNARIQNLEFRDGRLRFRVKSDALRARGSRENCVPMDAPMRPECMVKGKSPVPFVDLEVDLPIEDGVLDCRGASRREDCKLNPGSAGDVKPTPAPQKSEASWFDWLRFWD